MEQFQPLPLLWLLTDERNDVRLDEAIAALPPRSGIVFRHYHLEGTARRERYDSVLGMARRYGHAILVSRAPAGAWQADGTYGNPEAIADTRRGVRLATAHNAAEIDAAEASGADGIFLSPVFATQSHASGATLGLSGFHILAQRTHLPVIALGGMDPNRAAELGWPRWGAIDGLSRDS